MRELSPFPPPPTASFFPVESVGFACSNGLSVTTRTSLHHPPPHTPSHTNARSELLRRLRRPVVRRFGRLLHAVRVAVQAGQARRRLPSPPPSSSASASARPVAPAAASAAGGGGGGAASVGYGAAAGACGAVERGGGWVPVQAAGDRDECAAELRDACRGALAGRRRAALPVAAAGEDEELREAVLASVRLLSPLAVVLFFVSLPSSLPLPLSLPRIRGDNNCKYLPPICLRSMGFSQKVR